MLEDRVEGGGSGVAAARVGRASGAGLSVCGGPVFLRTQVARCSLARFPGRLPKTHATGIAYGATDPTPISIYIWRLFITLTMALVASNIKP